MIGNSKRITAMTLALLAGLTAANTAWADDEVDRVARLIDQQIAANWKASGVVPAPPSDDAEFCRRVYLALAGRVPYVGEALDFMEDDHPDKRRRLVDSLLDDNGYVNNFASMWRRVLPPSDSSATE